MKLSINDEVQIVDVIGKIHDQTFIVEAINGDVITIKNEYGKLKVDKTRILSNNTIICNDCNHLKTNCLCTGDDMTVAETTQEAVVEQNDPAKEQSSAPKLDIDQIKSYGELWVKHGVQFNHDKWEVKSYALLIDNPNRKLCFLTYNGVLGKKNEATEIFDLFKNNAPNSKGKIPGYVLKHDLDQERARLEKTGYSKL